jgi:hypothetical protein
MLTAPGTRPTLAGWPYALVFQFADASVARGIQDAAKSLVDRSIIWKSFCDVRFKQYDVGPLAITVYILSPDASTHCRKIVFGPHAIIRFGFLHKNFVRAG